MPHRIFRLTALFTALAFTLTACSSAAFSGSLSSPKELRSSVSEELPAELSGALLQGLVQQTAAVIHAVPRPVLTQADLDQALDEVLEEYSAAAVSVATVECGRFGHAGARGWAVKGEREMTPDTKVRVASLSKVVVAMCALAMAEDGCIDLDAPLSDYWGPSVRNPYSQGQPTARTLMTHTSSIKNLDTTWDLAGLQALLQSKSSWRRIEPGSGGYWYYSNFGMCVLGTTLELASGQVLDDYLQQRFLEPIGAQASFFAGRLDPDTLAALYTTVGVGRSVAEQAAQTPSTQPGQSASCFPGGFTVSAVDMAKLVCVLANDGVYKSSEYVLVEPAQEQVEYVIAQPDGERYTQVRLLSEQSVADMETPRFTVDLADSASFDQCLILRRQEDVLGQEVLYYHTGSAYGVYSLMTYNPETKNGVVVITTGARRNLNENGMYALCADLMDKLYAKMEGNSL